MGKRNKKNQDTSIDGLGWDLDDIGVPISSTGLIRMVPGQGRLSTTGQIADTAQFSLGLTGGGKNQRVIPITDQKLPQSSPASGTTNYLPDATTSRPPVMLNGQVVATGEQSQQVRNYINDPNLVQRAESPTKSWLASVFDTEDPDKSAAFGLENVWDGALKGLFWATDKINQVTSAGISGLPGGIDTLTWDEAADVSVGQAFLGSMGAAAGRIQRGEMTAGDIALAPLSFLSAGLAQIDPKNAAQRRDFDITNAEQRKKAFESGGAGQLVSGALDTAFTIFADPLIVGGKALKLARMTWVDRPIASVDDVNRLNKELADGMALQVQGRGNEAAPVAQFAQWATSVNEKTGLRRTAQEIFYHPVVRRSADREGISAALASADNYDDASLVIRYAAGDEAARAALMNKRADLAGELESAQRRALELQIAYNPEVRVKQIDKYKNRLEKLADETKRVEEAWARGEADDAALEFARRQELKATEDLQFIRDIKLPDPLENPVSKADVDMADKIVSELINRNKFLQRALREESQYALTMSTKGFAADNVFGRAVERSRQRRTGAAYETAVTQRRRTVTGEDTSKKTRFWVKDDFGNGALKRTARVWRYMGTETPSGLINTKGTGAMESVREIMAVLNDISIYGGAARTVTQTKKGTTISREVGGLRRKEELVKMYMDALQDSMRGTEAAAAAVNRIEDAIMRDMSLWYKIPADDARRILWTAQGKREDLLKNIRERGYWVEDGNINKSPFLESQLQNGTFMLNYRAFEKTVRKMQDEGRITRAWDSTMGYGAERLTNVYEAFNDFWRPAVLLRLGYTQRNVTEGLFRSSAFLFSLDPARYALGNAAYSARNIVIKQRTKAAVKQLEKTGDTPQFTRWREAQLEAAEKRILDREATVTTMLDEIKDAGLTGDDLADAMRDVRFFERMLDDSRAFRDSLLENDVAKALFTQQGYAKRRMFDGSIPGLKYGVLREAFDPDSGFADIAWSNMSADNTQRSIASLTSDSLGGLFQKKIQRSYVSVSPDKPVEYADGVASALNQFKNSELGDLIIRGKSADEIAVFLRKDPRGREIAAFLTRAEIVPKGGKPVQRVIDMDEATDVAVRLISRYQTIAPTPEIQAYMRGVKTVDARAIQRLLKDVPEEQLKPVIGNISEEVGSKRIRETWLTIANKGFEYLGTRPEDVFVRGPFYGLRYRESAKRYYDLALAQSKDGKVSMRQVSQIQRIAHRRALKDTKDWLYTIDRRTTLGRVGEYAFPFISATQNSVTTVGRILWNDPSVVGILALLWQAPDRLGWTDENGNIRISFPLNFLPQGVKEQFGLDNMLNVGFDKNQFNVVFPESGFGFLPRFGPIVAAPASEIMKQGWFGMSVETPSAMISVLGKETAEEVWTNWKKYLYGEEGGMSPDMLSWKTVSPPVVTKLIEMWQGEGASSSYAYAYNLQMRNEYAKWLGGYRDNPPDPDEIKQRTNGYYLARILANLTAFTPPRYESKLDPLIQAIRENDRVYGADGPRISNDQFGALLMLLGDFSGTKNVAGMRSATEDQVRVARNHAGLIKKIAPNLGDDLSVLGILLNRDVDAMYDPSSSAWQRTNLIPGTTETFRKLQDPEQAFVESSRQAGWVAWIQLSEQLKATLEQRGLKSFRSAGAADLRDIRDQAITQMWDNPMFRGWYDDFMDFGSQRTINSVELLREAVNDEGWMRENGATPVWQAAQEYLYHRERVLEGLRQSGLGINHSSNRQIRDYWDTVRANLDARYNGWSVISSRYLSGDDDPQEPGQSLTVVDQTDSSAGMQLFDQQEGVGMEGFFGIEEVPGG